MAFSLAIELVVASLVERLKSGRGGTPESGRTSESGSTSPRRRPVAGFAAALMTELLQTGVAEMRWQGRRLEAAVEHRAAVDSVLPTQRSVTRSSARDTAPSRRHGAQPTS